MQRILFGLSIVALVVLALAPGVNPPVLAQGACGNAPLSRLTAGEMARVTVGSGVGNNLRASASPDATVLGVMPEGEIMTVVSGPQCASDFNWWQVRRWNGQTGWTVEGTGGDYFLEPWPAQGAELGRGILPEPEEGSLAYLTDRDNNVEVYAMAANGQGATRLSYTTTLETAPVWSPDGQHVAFTDGREIYLAGIDGQNTVQVTTSVTGTNSMLAWSPDSTRIAFVSDRDGNPEIYVMNADGSNVVRLTDNTALDLSPAWSPDGRQIVFVSDRDGDSEIYVMNADGSNPVRLTTSPGIDQDPIWSPDGALIAFLSSRSSGEDVTLDLFVMNADGSDLRQLTDMPGSESAPTFSPDSTRIAFVGESLAAPSATELFSVRVDGTDLFQYTVDGQSVQRPTWSPDGERLAFASNRTGNYDIYLLRPSGAGLINLTDSLAREIAPVWSPRSELLPAAGQIPSEHPGAEDLLLIYDAGTPVFALINVSGEPVNLVPLSFTGADRTVPTSIWNTSSLSSPLNNFVSGGCLMLWSFEVGVQPIPPECGTSRQAWVSDTDLVFWTGPTFDVLYQGSPLTTCDSAAGRCVIDLP